MVGGLKGAKLESKTFCTHHFDHHMGKLYLSFRPGAPSANSSWLGLASQQERYWPRMFVKRVSAIYKKCNFESFRVDSLFRISIRRCIGSALPADIGLVFLVKAMFTDTYKLHFGDFGSKALLFRKLHFLWLSLPSRHRPRGVGNVVC